MNVLALRKESNRSVTDEDGPYSVDGSNYRKSATLSKASLQLGDTHVVYRQCLRAEVGQHSF